MTQLPDSTFLSNITVQALLGSGKFGQVYKGTWEGTTPVALKKLKEGDDLKSFASEITVLQYEYSSLLTC